MEEREASASTANMMKAKRLAQPDDGSPHWPRSFQLADWRHSLQVADVPINATQQSQQQPRWWSHTLYRGLQGQTPRILYSRTKRESEEIAQEFLDEKVLGFDMEWPVFESDERQRLQDKIGLIQIASESKIALFHIGLHNGKSMQDLIAPSLRKIIESQDIIKLGVNIVNADFSRLRQQFGLDPKGAFELSHLYSLVQYGIDRKVVPTTRLVKLSRQVEEVLGLPLSKDKAVRCSNWSQPLRMEQMKYAADDAYAGLMIYHCLNAKRAAMDPAPPLPVLADDYGTHLPSRNALCLQAPVTASEFFKRFNRHEQHLETHDTKPTVTSAADVEMKTNTFSGGNDHSTVNESTINTKRKTKDEEHLGLNEIIGPEEKEPDELHGLDALLYDLLVQCRREFATGQNIPPYMIAHNTHLKQMARLRPLQIQDLLLISGIGPKKAEQYGPAWLRVIREFTQEHQCQKTPPAVNSRGIKRRVVAPAQNQPHGAPELHTGLSFSMEQTAIVRDDVPDGDSDSAFDLPMEFMTSRIKRRRSHSSQRDASPTRPSRLSSTPVLKIQSSRGQNVSPQIPKICDTQAQREILERSGDIRSSQLQSPSLRQVYTQSPHCQDRRVDNPQVRISHDTKSQHSNDPSCQEDPIRPETQIFAKKLLAFSKQITLKLANKPATPILSEVTAHQIAIKPPHSNQELLKIPDVITFVRACAEVQVNLLDTIAKWTPAANTG